MGHTRLMVFLGMLLLAAVARTEEPLVLELRAGPRDRENVPVAVAIPQALSSAKALKLVRVDTGKAVPCQIDPEPSPRLVWMLEEKLPAGKSRQYRLSANGDSPQPSEGVVAKEGEGDFLLAIGKNPILRYRHASMPSADPEQPWYSRSGFIHPVYDPSRRILTDAMPADHMHQHGLMFAWVNASYEGRKIDFWNSAKKEGAVRHAKFLDRREGPVFAGFTAVLEHVDLKGDRVLLREVWEVRAYNRLDGYLFDLRSTHSVLGDKPLTVNKNDYGGMCIRATSAWLEPGQSDFLTGEGKTRIDGNHTRPGWCDITGKLDGKQAGMAAFDSPSNFRYPQPVRLHPTKPYFCFAPMVLGPFAIEPGKPYVSNYRFFAHSDKPDKAAIRKLAEDYGEPAVVKVEGK